MPFVRIEDVTRHYDHEVTALDRVSLEIRAGEWIAVMGPSGSGKTTLLNMLGGLDAPNQGRVIVDGLDLTRLTRPELIRYRRECVGLIFQQYHLIPYLTAVENVMLAQYLHSLADEGEAAKALEAVGLGGRLHHLPSALSGGEKQRVCIARALTNRPKLVLADEPTGSLDEENQRGVMDLFRKMHGDGQTIVMVTHDILVGQLADRQIQLAHGRVAGESLTHHPGEETIEHVLEYLWMKHEGHESAHVVCGRGFHLAQPELLDRMRSMGILEPGPGDVFSPAGYRRAENLIRRQRLAEILFSQTFQMREEVVEKEACYFEHVLSPVMTDSICSFLGHPETCPHGRPIPRGACCAAALRAARRPASE
jgi:putative ABC transport system ATP-binding protein